MIFLSEYKDRLLSVLDDVERIIEDEHEMVKLFLGELFNLLFWKDYRAGYVEIDTRHELIELIDCYTKRKSGCDEWYGFDDLNYVYSVISKVRNMIGLKEDLPK